LSEVAEKVTVIPLEVKLPAMLDIFMTDEYLFTVSHTSVFQFDLSGKFLREIDCGGSVAHSISGDTIKKELYIPVNNELKVYDFQGRLKKTYGLTNRSYGCFFYKNTLWIQSHKTFDNSIISYDISYLDFITEKESFLPIKIQKNMEEEGYFIIFPGIFTIQDKTVLFSFQRTDNTLYQIQKQDQRLNSFLNLKLQIPSQNREKNNKDRIESWGFIGKYLFVDYKIDDQFFLYMEDTKTGKRLHTKNHNGDGIIEDVFNSGMCTKITTFNREGHFFFSRKKESISEKSIDGHLVKNGPVVFIVKTK